MPLREAAEADAAMRSAPSLELSAEAMGVPQARGLLGIGPPAGIVPAALPVNGCCRVVELDRTPSSRRGCGFGGSSW